MTKKAKFKAVLVGKMYCSKRQIYSKGNKRYLDNFADILVVFPDIPKYSMIF